MKSGYIALKTGDGLFDTIVRFHKVIRELRGVWN